MKYVRKDCKVIERWDGHVGDVKVLGEVWRLPESVTVGRGCKRY